VEAIEAWEGPMDDLFARRRRRRERAHPLRGHLRAQPERLGELVQLMLDRGYGKDVIRSILAGNLRRVYAACER
jgi:hypothetical protein